MDHLLGIEALSAGEIEHLLDQTDRFAEVNRRRVPKVPALHGRTVASLFYEESTRTRLSFEQAAKRLSADTLNFAVSSSSVRKGESLRDTVETIEAMGVDGIVVRHSSAGVPAQITRWVGASVINAGDGWHEHPTQALLDCFTIREHLGGVDGLRIGIVGDIERSRVARSDVLAFSRLGADVTLVAPPTMLPASLEGWPVRVTHDLDAVLPSLDVVYLLRVQRERMTEALVPSLREYTSRFGLTRRRADLLSDKAIVMHPGPMNRGVEIAADVAELPSAVVVDQVRNGVAVRMAVLYELLAQPWGAPDEEIAPPLAAGEATTRAGGPGPGTGGSGPDAADAAASGADGAASVDPPDASRTNGADTGAPAADDGAAIGAQGEPHAERAR